MQDKCYMCDASATSREHVPPLGFFPTGNRTNLLTVASCEVHNAGNSKDVEYVRNAICFQLGINESGERVSEIAKRSFDRSPNLFRKTFESVRPIIVEGEETGIFPVDLERVKRVMTAISHGLASRDFGRTYIGNWHIFCATLRHTEEAFPGDIEKWRNLQNLLRQGVFTEMQTSEPDIFRYAVHRPSDRGLVYRLTFYGGFIVYAWPVLARGESGART